MPPATTSTPAAEGDMETHRPKKAKTNRGEAGPAGADPIDQEPRATQRKEPPRITDGSGPIVVDLSDPNALEKDGRTYAPLPKRTNQDKTEMTSIMHRFSPDDWEGLPTHKDKNPHLRLTRPGDRPPAELSTQDVNFTNAQFPHAHVPIFKLFGNVAAAQEAALKKRASSKIILAAVIHGGGQRYIRRSPEKADEIKSFIKSISLANDDNSDRNVEVYIPEMRNESDRNRFGQPWTFFIELDAAAVSLSSYLLWQEVFPIHPALSFSIHPVDGEDQQAWNIMVLTGKPGAVVDTTEAKREVLAAVKQAVWDDPDFCHFAAHHVTNSWGVHGEVDARVKAATDTLDAVYVLAEAVGSERPVPAYLITGRPVATDKEAHKQWLCLFKAPRQFWRGVYALETGQALVDCKLCKDTSHCAWDCPLPMVPGWAGIQPDVIYRDPKTVEDAKAASLSKNAGDAMAAGPSWMAPGTAPTAQAKEIWKDANHNRRGGRGGRGGRGSRGGRGGHGAGRGGRKDQHAQKGGEGRR